MSNASASNVTNGAAIIPQGFIQETFDAYVPIIIVEYFTIDTMWYENSFVLNAATAGAISELFTSILGGKTITQRKLLAIVLYNILLEMSREIEYMWLKPLTFPSYLYILARYATLIELGLSLTFNLMPMSVVSCAFFESSQSNV